MDQDVAAGDSLVAPACPGFCYSESIRTFQKVVNRVTAPLVSRSATNQPLSPLADVLLVKVGLVHLEAGHVQGLGEDKLPSCRALCAAARMPSTQSFSSARSAVCLAPTPAHAIYLPLAIVCFFGVSCRACNSRSITTASTVAALVTARTLAGLHRY